MEAEPTGRPSEASPETAPTQVPPDASIVSESATGGAAALPTPRLRELPRSAWWYAVRRSLHNFVVGLRIDVAGTLTYYAVLSLFPALLALTTLLSLVGEQEATSAWLLDFAATYLNPELVELLREPIVRLTSAQHANWVLVVSLVVSIWAAKGYVSAFGRAMNRVFGVVEGRPIWIILPLNVLLTAGTLVVGVLIPLAMVFSNNVVAALLAHAENLREFLDRWGAFRWPIVLVTVMIYTAALYHFTPNVRRSRLRLFTPGSILAAVGIALAVLGFNIYVDRFATVSDTYGVAGSFILLLLGLWLINCALLFGGEFDAELERVCQLYAGVEAERELRLPPRDTRMIHAVDKALEKLVDEGRRMRESASDLARRPGPAAEDDAAV